MSIQMNDNAGQFWRRANSSGERIKRQARDLLDTEGAGPRS